MELKDLSYWVLEPNVKVKIYLNGVLDEESKKYFEEQKKLFDKLRNLGKEKSEEIYKEIEDLSEHINNVVLYEGLNKDIPSEVLNKTWIEQESVHIENGTLIIPVIKYLSIKDIQDKLKDREFYELDFYDNVSIVISNDNIYVKRWAPCNSNNFADLKGWYEKYLLDGDKYHYEQIKDYSSELIDLIGEEMRVECKYTLGKFGED